MHNTVGFMLALSNPALHPNMRPEAELAYYQALDLHTVLSDK